MLQFLINTVQLTGLFFFCLPKAGFVSQQVLIFNPCIKSIYVYYAVKNTLPPVPELCVCVFLPEGHPVVTLSQVKQLQDVIPGAAEQLPVVGAEVQ